MLVTISPRQTVASIGKKIQIDLCNKTLFSFYTHTLSSISTRDNILPNYDKSDYCD